MNRIAFCQRANEILNQVGLGPASGDFTADVAWGAHETANERRNTKTILRALLDIEEHYGPGSIEEAVVQTIVNCGPIILDTYPISRDVWDSLGFEVYKNGDGSHGAHIPMWLRSDTEVAH